VKKSVVKSSKDFEQYPSGERHIEYNNGQVLFREPYKHPLRWDLNTRRSLVRLLRATRQVEAWEFILKEQYSRPWYLVRVYHPNRRGAPVITMDSDSLNVFVAQCAFYCIGFRAKLMDTVYGGEGIGEPDLEVISKEEMLNGTV
jgi:hypothetical protein